MVEGAPGQDGTASGGSEAEEPALAGALALVGSKLDDLGATAVGRIEGFLVDARDGAPTWLVVRLGRFGRRAPVPFGFAAAGVGRAWVPCSRGAIREAAALDPLRGLTVADERTLCRHYGIPEDWGRPAVLADRTDDDAGSIPG